MKRLCSFLILLMLSAAAMAERAGVVRILSVDTDARSGNEKGVSVNCEVRASGCYGRALDLCAWFFEEVNGERKRLTGAEFPYAASDGQACVFTGLDADSDKSCWNPVKLFIPYSCLPGREGWNNLQVMVTLRDKQDDYSTICQSEYVPFTVRRDRSNAPEHKPPFIAKIKSVTHGSVQEGIAGIMLTCDMTFVNLRGHEVEVSIMCFGGVDGNGGELRRFTSSLTPSYNISQWDSYEFFIPYSALLSVNGKREVSLMLMLSDTSDRKVEARTGFYNLELTRRKGIPSSHGL